MAREDRDRWDARYLDPHARQTAPSPYLVSLDVVLPRRGKAIDVAGGTGASAVWLARRGLNVTLADISPVGLALARHTAEAEGVRLETLEIDLELQPFPHGSWDLVLCLRFLWRPLFEAIPASLAPGGLLVVALPTRSNLKRNPRPPAHYLLDDGELPRLVRGLDVLSSTEGWTDEGVHEARLVARRGARAGS
jgi:SAM-dependent methyltransferase